MPVEINRDIEDLFIPRRGLKGGHMQTLAAYFAHRADRLPPAEERLFSVEQDVQVLCHCHWQPERQNTTTLMIVHGLEGSSTSEYVVGTANKAWAAGMNVGSHEYAELRAAPSDSLQPSTIRGFRRMSVR